MQSDLGGDLGGVGLDAGGDGKAQGNRRDIRYPTNRENDGDEEDEEEEVAPARHVGRCSCDLDFLMEALPHEGKDRVARMSYELDGLTIINDAEAI